LIQSLYFPPLAQPKRSKIKEDATKSKVKGAEGKEEKEEKEKKKEKKKDGHGESDE